MSVERTSFSEVRVRRGQIVENPAVLKNGGVLFIKPTPTGLACRWRVAVE